ncbi:septum formation initiator family protein [Oscillibacter valericigenes]|nr:septum formation initiator family protein [Oscillibacter valericigenes]
MAEEKTARKKKGGTALAKLLLLALLLLVGAQLLRLRERIDQAETELSTLSAQVEQQQQENDALSSALDKADDPDYLEQLARDAGYVKPDEKIFVPVN